MSYPSAPISELQNDGIAPIPGEINMYSLSRFYGPGQLEALPPGEPNRADLIQQGGPNSSRFLRYSTGQRLPSHIIGLDHNIRALTAENAISEGADLVTLSDDSKESLRDFSAFLIPAGLIVEYRLHAQHDVAGDARFSAFVYEITPNIDAVKVSQGIGFSRGVADPLGVQTITETPRTSVNLRYLIDAQSSKKIITSIGYGFDNDRDANGNWFQEFEVLKVY